MDGDCLTHSLPNSPSLGTSVTSTEPRMAWGLWANPGAWRFTPKRSLRAGVSPNFEWFGLSDIAPSYPPTNAKHMVSVSQVMNFISSRHVDLQKRYEDRCRIANLFQYFKTRYRRKWIRRNAKRRMRSKTNEARQAARCSKGIIHSSKNSVNSRMTCHP